MILLFFATASVLADVSSNNPMTISSNGAAGKFEKCGTIQESFLINGTIGMPLTKSPIQVRVYYPNGTIYDSHRMSFPDVSLNGNYRHWVNMTINNGTIFGPYNVTVSYNGYSAHTSIHPFIPSIVRSVEDNLKIVDVNGQELHDFKAGHQIQIQDSIEPICGSPKFVYVLYIVGNNQVASLSWLEGSDQNLPMNFSQMWTPIVPGNYTINRFVWSSLEQPNALLPALARDIQVK